MLDGPTHFANISIESESGTKSERRFYMIKHCLHWYQLFEFQ